MGSMFRHWHGLLVLAMILRLANSATGEEPVRLQEAFPSGYQYHVSSRVELSGQLQLPAEKSQPAGAGSKALPITGESAIEYDERVLAASTAGEVEKTLRIYRRNDFQRKVGDRLQESTLRTDVRRLILLRLKPMEVPFSPDGPLTWGEIDLIRTDVFTPALAGLLPQGPVQPGDRWTAAGGAVEELTDLERIEEGKIECRLEQLTRLEGRRLARISLAGTVRGVNEDGPNRQQLDGYFFFDLDSRHVSYLSIHGIHFLLDKDSKELGRVEGRFVLTRQAHQRSADLTDAALAGVATEPSADNTLLLYDNPDLGIRFLHPRRWRMAGVHGRQLALDETNGSGLLLTLEPADQVPTAAQFLTESRQWLQKQRAKIVREHEPSRLRETPREVERFTLEMEFADKPAVMDYYVLRQPQGGATLAARLLPSDLVNLRQEVERIARSVTLTRTVVELKK